jgi:minor extracellular serine protease Vpr
MRGSRRPFGPVLLAMAMALAMAVPAVAASSPERVQPDRTTPWDAGERPTDAEFATELWFVEFSAAPAARGGSNAAMNRERNTLRTEARASGIDYEQRYDFRRLWNGISVRTTASEARALAELSGAAAVYPVELVDAPEPLADEEPHLGTALGMTGADVAQSELGYAGTGISVAVVDTGIDYGHPDLGGEGEGTSFPTDRVTHGYDFAGDDYNAADPERDEPQPNPDPMDINGHGTHVAGIVGAQAADDDGVTGVAPEVSFGAYKVFGTSGSSSADVIIAALEQAHADEMDVVNMSLGASFAWGDYPTSKASDTLVDEGVVVVASAGNSGANGAFSLGAPGNAEKVIGVASADNLFMNAHVMRVDGLTVAGTEDGVLPYGGMSSAELPPTEGESDPIVWIGRGCLSEGDTLAGDPAGKTALMVRGVCTFDEKYRNAVAAGATGVIIYNNVAGMFAGGGIVPKPGVWAAATTDTHGAALRAMVEGDDSVTATFTDEETQVANPTGGLLSSFSSYGMTPDLQFRPDITGPGGLIESTYPLASGGYATVSGTSMSAPHVAGGVALLLEARPELEADEVRGVLQNSAEPLAWSLAPGAGFLDHTFRQGAGMLRIDRSITATTAVSPSRIAIGEAGTTPVELTIANTGDEAVTYTLGHTGTIGTGGFGTDEWGDWATIFYPQFSLASTSAAFSSNQLTVAAGGSETVSVTITNPATGLYAHQVGGFLTVSAADGDQKVVPYAGMGGELGDIEVWPAEREAAIGLANQLVARYDDDGRLVAVDPGHEFDREAGETPVAALFMGFGAERLEVTARHVASGHEVPVAEVDHARRSGTPTEYIPYTWDGREQVGASQGRRYAPRGEWVFDVRALLPRVDADDPEVWVEDTTEPFELTGGPQPRQPETATTGRGARR